jgi:hypothetical protein
MKIKARKHNLGGDLMESKIRFKIFKELIKGIIEIG